MRSILIVLSLMAFSCNNYHTKECLSFYDRKIDDFFLFDEIYYPSEKDSFYLMINFQVPRDSNLLVSIKSSGSDYYLFIKEQDPINKMNLHLGIDSVLKYHVSCMKLSSGFVDNIIDKIDSCSFFETNYESRENLLDPMFIDIIVNKGENLKKITLMESDTLCQDFINYILAYSGKERWKLPRSYMKNKDMSGQTP